jgi:hypothetical protein
MKKSISAISLVSVLAGAMIGSYADYVVTEGFLTDSNNWNKGVFDSSLNPAAGTSTGASRDFIAGGRTMIMASDYATFDRFSLGTDGNTNNVSAGFLEIIGGTLTATDLVVNVNNVNTGAFCSVVQSGGSVTVYDQFDVGKLGGASYTVSGGSFNVGGNASLGQGSAGHEHTFAIEGQAAANVTVSGNFFGGAGAGTGYQNLYFRLGEAGITPLTVGGSFYADGQTEIIVDGTDYTGGVQTVTLATYANNEDGAGVIQSFVNFNAYLPELIFTNGALILNLTLNPNPELLLDSSFEGLENTEPNTNSTPWFTVGENQNFSFVPTAASEEVRTGLQAAKFNFYFDAGAVAQNVDKTLEAGETYAYSVWNLITQPSTNSAHTNASTFNLSVWTSPTNGGTYTYRKGLFGNIATNENEYQHFTFTFTTADIVNEGAGLGDNIQVRIAKANAGSTHKLCFDEASLKTVEGIDNSYASWAGGWDVVIGAETEDYDSDGLLNLYEYGLGGNPTNGFVNGNLPDFGPAAGGFTYVYVRRSDDPALEYYLETTESLLPAGWTNSGSTAVATNVTGGTFDYVTNTVPSIKETTFIRLRIQN